ncbi:hypothetical protein K461DRAFT_174418 [Myriangium duriaei CBS 260.36]|uniref:Fungal-specific transcription factor domain-containing protein n=1 Tax=Myriangium duriaei CBS 260.36 TaxID=1168546 RepID=A0A9P4MFV7_9PEZI|nr:hypothetical protein K461DRAFT_174418 [Myriangium duriaei CBS 260.36]
MLAVLPSLTTDMQRFGSYDKVLMTAVTQRNFTPYSMQLSFCSPWMLESLSMHGHWNTHLIGAYSLLESFGGLSAITMSSRLEAQVGILTWWDAIISLLAREECVFPQSYFDTILSQQSKREWNFFGLCGCPTKLVEIIMRLARTNVKNQQLSSPSREAIENPGLVGLERALECWTHQPSMAALLDEESVHQDQDVMHCSEAWRNGLLLYVYRVFHWKSGTGIPTHVMRRARNVVDHVSACRNTEMISRQALLPLFFAGCELQDLHMRKQIINLCVVWDERTRYHLFLNTIPLLEAVWAEQKTKGPDNVWWGQIVDREHDTGTHPLKMRLCFG